MLKTLSNIRKAMERRLNGVQAIYVRNNKSVRPESWIKVSIILANENGNSYRKIPDHLPKVLTLRLSG